MSILQKLCKCIIGWGLLLVGTQTYSQEKNAYQFFYYETSMEAYFRLHPGAYKKILYIQMDRNDIVSNTLFPIDDTTKKLEIPSDGYYEIFGAISFNLNTGNIHFSRAGINFGFVKVFNQIEQYIASTRWSFTEENQNTPCVVHIPKTIVYLEKGAVIAPALSTGLLDKPIVNAHIAPYNNEFSLQWGIKKISNEQGHQTFY